ncbi:MAG: type II secretion system F family protein [Planctomycetota bacterium]|jgi:Flp pilus assembly protein TadB
MTTTFIILGWVILAVGVYLVAVRTARQQRIRERLLEGAAEDRAERPERPPEPARLTRWLSLAGFRRPGAPGIFLAWTLLAFLIGLAVAWALLAGPFVTMGAQWLRAFPGGAGEVFVPIITYGPWVVGLIVALIPWLHVRRERRRIVQEVEEDLPITLEILATLSRAGLGFDAALVRVLESTSLARPLPAEFRTFQMETLAGVSRVQALRRLASRLEVTSVSIFISALAHAEQVGSGLAEVLHRQAGDVRNRRREQALAQAQSLPAKLVFPLVLCFLPGIFVWTLGPAFYQFIRLADTVFRGG